MRILTRGGSARSADPVHQELYLTEEHFSTKGDNRVREIDTQANQIAILYERRSTHSRSRRWNPVSRASPCWAGSPGACCSVPLTSVGGAPLARPEGGRVGSLGREVSSVAARLPPHRAGGTSQPRALLLQYLAFLAGIVLVYSLLFHLMMLYEGQYHTWFTGFYWT